MESTTGYASDFMPGSAAPGYPSAVEAADTTIVSTFASLINSLHADGSTQEALEITAGTAVPGIGAQGAFFKVESAPPYPSFKSISFFRQVPLDREPDFAIGRRSLAAQPERPNNPASRLRDRRMAALPPALRQRRFDSVRQDSESSPEIAVAGATAPYLPSITSTGSRLAVTFDAAAASDQAWITQVLLEDSVGSVALLFQGQAVYADPELKLAIGDTPIVSDIKLSGDSQAAVDSTPYVSGGGEIDSDDPLRAGRPQGSSHRGERIGRLFQRGPRIILPAADFPIKVEDEFDYDPSSGAFGRDDSFSIHGASVASLSLEQNQNGRPLPTPSMSACSSNPGTASSLLGPSIATIGLSADNRSRPPGAVSPDSSGRELRRGLARRLPVRSARLRVGFGVAGREGHAFG